MNGWLRYNVRCSADVAQSVEHLIGNEEVGSSNLLISSKQKKRHPKRGAVFLFWAVGNSGGLSRELAIGNGVSAVAAGRNRSGGSISGANGQTFMAAQSSSVCRRRRHW